MDINDYEPNLGDKMMVLPLEEAMHTPAWMEAMNKFAGRILTVTEVSWSFDKEMYVRFEESEGWWFHMNALQPVDGIEDNKVFQTDIKWSDLL